MILVKEKAIIYGLGNRVKNYYFFKYLLPEIEKRYNILGISDKVCSTNIEVFKYSYIEPSDKLNEADVIIVTSDLYYDEIVSELNLKYGIDNFISLTCIENQIINVFLRGELFSSLSGVEVGGPSRIFECIYRNVDRCDDINFSTNTVWWEYSGQDFCYNGRSLGDIMIADAVNLSKINDNTYDFCISSNNLEHIANPLKAIKEFIRILKSNGIILIVVPRKEDCFDHNRSITSFEHLLKDYLENIDEYDLSHLKEILELHDYEMDPGIKSAKEFEIRAENNYDNRCLHHHVFDDDVLREIYKYFDIKVVDSGQLFNNYFILGRVLK